MLHLSKDNCDHVENKKYETVIHQNNIHKDVLNSCLDIALKYIIENNLILYGGMSIDFSLKFIGKTGIYSKYTFPDYDFYSSRYYEDSIELANILHKQNINNVSSINAYHLTSRKVRYNFMEVADISYIPKNIFDNLPFIVYDKIKIIHPNFQRLDMHKSLSNLYTNSPLDNFRHRVKKDISRFNLISTSFPMKSDYIISKKTSKIMIPINDLKNKCITGLLAFCIFLSIYDSHNDRNDHDFDKFRITSTKSDIIIEIPDCCNFLKISLMSTDFIKEAECHNSSKKYYRRFLDDVKFRNIHVGKYEFLDSYNTMISSKNICEIDALKNIDWIKNLKHSDNIYIATSHNVLQYFLCEYFILKFKKNHNFKVLLWLYTKLHDVTKYFNEILMEPFIIMSTYYGFNDINYQYLIMNQKYNAELNDNAEYLSEITNILPNMGYYPDKNTTANPFNYESWVFKSDGCEQTEKFIKLNTETYKQSV